MKKHTLQLLQDYLLGLDKGFAFEAGPKRIPIDGDQYIVDQLFYNYKLKCFVLIDLHIGEQTQQSSEKMQRCVNYYAREAIKNSDIIDLIYSVPLNTLAYIFGNVGSDLDTINCMLDYSFFRV